MLRTESQRVLNQLGDIRLTTKLFKFEKIFDGLCIVDLITITVSNFANLLLEFFNVGTQPNSGSFDPVRHCSLFSRLSEKQQRHPVVQGFHYQRRFSHCQAKLGIFVSQKLRKLNLLMINCNYVRILGLSRRADLFVLDDEESQGLIFAKFCFDFEDVSVAQVGIVHDYDIFMRIKKVL